MEGQCLCGAVKISAPDVTEAHACHCSMCRRWGGGPMLAVHCGPTLTFSGSEHINLFASSEWANRAFCKICGTHLYYHLKINGEYFVSAGLFAHAPLQLKAQLYTDCKPAYYALSNETLMFTEADVLAMYSQNS